MNPENRVDTIPYTPLHTYKDLERKEIAGIGVLLLVINDAGNIYIVEEKNPTKEGYNIIAETSKYGEFMADTVRGALTEEVGVDDQDFRDFQYVPQQSYQGRLLFPKNGQQLHADIVVIAYTGNKKKFNSRNEVKGVGFKSLREILDDSDQLRPGILPALQLVSQNNTIPKIMESIKNGRAKLVFIDERLTADLYFNQRQQKPDLLNY